MRSVIPLWSRPKVDASLEANDESPSTTIERTTTNDKNEKRKGPVASSKKPKKDSCGTTQNCVKCSVLWCLIF
ncbi:hypothetical protein RIF29_33723 [Crotalaria pallida]|uniref:Uncharacterized protein n=1 Tax=Crotalaria pallida TaxID=3830 RepID=A0AAN9EDY1_CROPI